MKEALQWWKREMMRDPLVSLEAFQEQVYQIEHAYGLMGKRKPAFGWSCRKTSDVSYFPVPKANSIKWWS